jgi:hypothetical protein
VIAIREHELSILYTHQGAVLLIHASHVLETAGTITDLANYGFCSGCLRLCFLSDFFSR